MLKKRILLSFSGGLDTSAIIPWLKEVYQGEVVAFCADLGNSPKQSALEKWAKHLGAEEFIFEDLRDEFVSEFVFPALKAGAVYQDEYLLGTALGRPLIAQRLAYWAKKFGCSAIAHGATGKGNDQFRIENGISYFAPEMEIIAPWRKWDFESRTDLMHYLNKKGFETSFSQKIYSEDVNLFHRSCEGGVLEDPTQDYSSSEVLKWTNLPESGVKPTQLEIQFELGVPTRINGVSHAPSEILQILNQIGCQYGFGVADVIEERKIGFKSRGVYETPGGTLLFHCLRQLKHLCWDRDLLSISQGLASKYADLVYDGFWHTDAKIALDAFFNQAAKVLSGSVGIEISTGGIKYLKRESPYSLLSEDLSSFEKDPAQLNRHAEGLCKVGSYKLALMGKRAQKQGST